MIFHTQKVQKLKFLYNFIKSKISQSSKNVQHVTPCLDILRAKFQVNISIFGKHLAQKPYPLMTSFFTLQFWVFLDFVPKNDIFGILRLNWFRSTHVLFEKSQLENLTLFAPGLTLPSLTLPCRWLPWS